MPIVAADIHHRYSGGASNSVANASLGGDESSVNITTAQANNLFDDVDASESLAGDIEYRGYYIHNTHATLPYLNPVVWISVPTGNANSYVDIGVAAEAVNQTMATIGNESSAPASVVFTAPSTRSVGLPLDSGTPGSPSGQLDANGGKRGIWIRRTTVATAPATSNSFTIAAGGDTGP